MEVIIRGTSEEIAALVLALQEQRQCKTIQDVGLPPEPNDEALLDYFKTISCMPELHLELRKSYGPGKAISKIGN